MHSNLNDSDEHNRDGWRLITDVFPTFRLKTGTVLLTGHGTMRIADEGFRKYGVEATIEKDAINIIELKRLVKSSAEKYERERAGKAKRYSILRSLEKDSDCKTKMLNALNLPDLWSVISSLTKKIIPSFFPLVLKKNSLKIFDNWMQVDFWSRWEEKLIRIYIGTRNALGPRGENIPQENIFGPIIKKGAVTKLRAFIQEYSGDNADEYYIKEQFEEGGGDEVEDENEDIDQHELMTGAIVLMKSSRPDEAFHLFKRYLDQGLNGLYITRLIPSQLNKFHLQDVPHRLLTNETKKHSLRPTNFERIPHILRTHLKNNENSIILLEGIEFLIIQNKFSSVLRMIQALCPIVGTKDAILLLPLNSSTLDEQKLAQIESSVGQIIEVGGS